MRTVDGQAVSTAELIEMLKQADPGGTAYARIMVGGVVHPVNEIMMFAGIGDRANLVMFDSRDLDTLGYGQHLRHS